MFLYICTTVTYPARQVFDRSPSPARLRWRLCRTLWNSETRVWLSIEFELPESHSDTVQSKRFNSPLTTELDRGRTAKGSVHSIGAMYAVIGIWSRFVQSIICNLYCSFKWEAVAKEEEALHQFCLSLKLQIDWLMAPKYKRLVSCLLLL